MNKNFSLILNAIIAVAIGVLYYLHFSAGSTADEKINVADNLAVEKPIIMAPSEIKASKIVFVNLDILSDGYDFLKDVSSSAQAEQNNLQNQYQTKGEKLQQDYMQFQEKANKGLLSENQIATEQEKFTSRKEELDQLQLKSEAFFRKFGRFIEN